MRDVQRTFGDPQNDSLTNFVVVPGEELLDNAMLSNLLVQANVAITGGTVEVLDTTFFAYDGYVFERQAKYICERKMCDSVVLDGDMFNNKPVYRIHELTKILRYYDSNGPGVWLHDTHYYSVVNSGTHVISTLCYAKEIAVGSIQAKFVENYRSNNLFRQAHKGDDFDLTLSPVPASSALIININVAIPQQSVSFDVLNMEGRVVKHFESGPTGFTGFKSVSLDISVLPPGIYMLRAACGAGILTKRFSIVR